ncbi:MAG: AI-2E family transporter [Candidatus Fimivivens sp.]|nr:AI-2E family transporter [Candidatus Fimivivens sp.]
MQNKRELKRWLLLITYAALMAALIIKLDAAAGVLKQLFLLLIPVFVGGALAFVLKRPFHLVGDLLIKNLSGRSKRLAVPLALLLVYSLLFGSLALIVSVLVPQLAESLRLLRQNVETFAPTLTLWAQRTQNDLSVLKIDFSPYYDMLQKLPEWLGQLLLGAVPQLFSVTNSVVRSIVNLGLGLVFSVYLLLCHKTLAEQTERLIKAMASGKAYLALMHTGRVINNTFTRFVIGQLTEALILGSLCFVGMVLLRFEYALLISVLIGLTSLVPIVGAFVGLVPAVFILLMISPKQALGFLVFIIVLQQVEGNLIYPRVVGSSIGLPPLWILLAITVGGGMFGILGMLLAVPITSVIYQLMGEVISHRLAEKQIEQESSES